MTEQPAETAIPQWDMSDRLRKALAHAGVSSNEMAEYLEVSRHTISNWINGRTRPPATAVMLWSMKCGVPYEWINGGRGSSHNPGQLCDDAANASAERPTTREIAALAKPINDLIPLRRPTPHRSVTRGADR